MPSVKHRVPAPSGPVIPAPGESRNQDRDFPQARSDAGPYALRIRIIDRFVSPDAFRIFERDRA